VGTIKITYEVAKKNHPELAAKIVAKFAEDDGHDESPENFDWEYHYCYDIPRPEVIALLQATVRDPNSKRFWWHFEYVPPEIFNKVSIYHEDLVRIKKEIRRRRGY